MIWGSGAFRARRAASRSRKPCALLRVALLAGVGLGALGARAAWAETISGALIKAYLTNPDINTQRAAVRVADEGVPKANAGYLPTVEATGNIGIERAQTSEIGANNTAIGSQGVFLKPRGYGVQASETVFNGSRTLNSIRQAESQVLGAREQLRNTEQNTLLSGVTAYMDVLEDTAILDLDRNNVDVLKEQLRETRDRFTVGEVTRTDVAQAEASLSSAEATALSAVATLQAAVARYRQFIGDQPTSLAPVKPLVRPIPKTLPEAISISQVEHPAIGGSLHGVDAAELQVKIAEGALYPTIGLSASVTNQLELERKSPVFTCCRARSRARSPSRSIRAGQSTPQPARPKRACRNRKCRLILCETRSVRLSSPPGASMKPRSAWCARPARRSPPTKWR